MKTTMIKMNDDGETLIEIVDSGECEDSLYLRLVCVFEREIVRWLLLLALKVRCVCACALGFMWSNALLASLECF